MEIRDLSRIVYPPLYAIVPVVSVSEQATNSERTYTFGAKVLRVSAPHCERYTVWYKGELEPKLYRTRDTAIARAKRLVNADVKALQEGRPAPC